MLSSQKVLVDTDVLIDFLRQREIAKQLLDEASQLYDLYSSVITVAELLAGMRPSEQEVTEALLDGLTLVPVTETIARRAGTLRYHARPKNVLLPDCLIAATALEEGCLLLTFNRKDYPFGGLEFFSK